MAEAFLDHCQGQGAAALDAFFANAPIFMLAAGPDWTIRRASRHLAEALGTTEAALSGTRFAEWLAPESRGRLAADLGAQIAASGRITGAELDLLRADGTALQVVMEARVTAPVEGDPEARTEILAVLHDNAEARAARATLVRAVEEARAAERAKARLLAAMGHEIRTPLNVILGFAQLLKRSGLDGTRLAHVAAIESAGRTLMDLLGDLLDLSQAEAGRVKIDLQPFDLDAFLSQIADWWQAPAAAKWLGFRLVRDPRLPAVVISDPERIRQVLNNFLGNAVKFTEAGSVTLSVAEAARDDSVLRLRFAVADTGPGLTPEEAAQIFRPFVRVGAGRDPGGWGLGLSICREVAQAMGGSVGVDAAPGKGATFHFELDVGVPADEPPAAP